MMWLNFILGLDVTFLCFIVIITHYHTKNQMKIKFKPRKNNEPQHQHYLKIFQKHFCIIPHTVESP